MRYRKPKKFKKTQDFNWDWVIMIVGAVGVFVFLYLAGIGTGYLMTKL